MSSARPTPPFAKSNKSLSWLRSSPALLAIGGRTTPAIEEVAYPGVGGGRFCVVESIKESPFTWCVPHAWLTFALWELQVSVDAVQRQLVDERQRLGRSEVERGEGNGIHGEAENWREESVLDRLQYDLARERHSSHLAWLRSRLLKLEQH
ncbi:MAG: hypothetical protein SGPRY_015013, partial [Prymnesium sp.]